MLRDWKKIIVAATWTSWLSVRNRYWDSKEGQEELKSYAELDSTNQTYGPNYSDDTNSSDTLNDFRNITDAKDPFEKFDRIMGDNEVPLGCIAPGFAADIIATDGNLETDLELAVTHRKISFVMKNGVVYKKDGIPRT
jgi:hypothetical protein